MKMTTTYDKDTRVDLSVDFVMALHDLMRAMLAMMREAEPEMAEAWTWGYCEVEDLEGLGNGLRFQYGGEEERPDWLVGETAVLSRGTT